MFFNINFLQIRSNRVLTSSNLRRKKTSLFCFFIALLSLPLFLTSCPSTDQNTPDTQKARVLTDNTTDDLSTGGKDRDEDEEKDNLPSSCSNNSRDSVSFSGKYDYVDSINVGNYELKGRCKERDQVVSIKVNGYPISEDPACNRGRWELVLDLSSVATSEKKIFFEAHHNGGTACVKALVGFLGPKNYIPVPYIEDQYEGSFYVMKYEAKIENKGTSEAKAISKPEEEPLTRISHADAVKLCRNNGSRYDLIQNSQWQNIALSIEETDINWSKGRPSLVDNNSLNCGIVRGSPQPANDDDRDDCADSSCSKNWDFKRRTHLLSNGAVIWDMCGNVAELMKDKYSVNKSFKGYIFELTEQLKNLFGPDRTYKTGDDKAKRNRNNHYWGLGKADIESGHNLIIRGGGSSSEHGIFSVSITGDQNSRSSHHQVGFRCVYIP